MNTVSLYKPDRSKLLELHDLPTSVTENIQNQIIRLRQEYSCVRDCRVSVKVPEFHQDGCYYIQIGLSTSELGINRELTIDRSPLPSYYQEDLYVAIWSAFNLAKTKLQEHLRPVHGANKSSSQDTSSIRPVTLRRSVGYAGG
jgi:hypothetical protein